MNVFVTGGTGFVGQVVIKDLIRDGHSVMALSRSRRSDKFLSSLGAKPIRGDLLKVYAFKHHLANVSAIVHCAALVEMWSSYHDFYSVNVKGTKYLLKAAIHNAVSQFIFVSAASVVMEGYALHNVNEDYTISSLPIDNYSRSKAEAEQIVISESNRIKTLILRPPFVWGVDMPLVEVFRERIQKKGLPTIGHPNHHLATCHVANLSKAINTALVMQSSGLYYVTDGENISLKDFLFLLATANTLDIGDRSMSRVVALRMAKVMEFAWRFFGLKGAPPLTISMVNVMGNEFTIDDSKLRNEFNFENAVSIEEGISEIYAISQNINYAII